MNPLILQVPEAGVSIARAFMELGVAGAMLYWFAMRNETKVDILGSKMDDNTWATVMMAKTQLISLVALGQLDSAVRKQAEGLLNEITQKYPDRGVSERGRK